MTSPSKIALLEECKMVNCELIESARVRIVCKGEATDMHKPAFLFSEITDREFISYHLVSLLSLKYLGLIFVQ